MAPSRGRRLAIAFVAIAAAGALLHGQISAALVVRGDEYLYRSQPTTAAKFYRRALSIDSGNAVAVDRLAFLGVLTHQPALLREGVAAASRFLRTHRDDATVRADRGLAYRLLKRPNLAEADLRIAGTLRGDPEELSFAASLARLRGDRSGARALWRAALARDPRYAPALAGLERLR